MLELPLWANSNMYQQQTEKRRETILKLTLIKPIIFASLQHVKLPINV